MKPMLALVLHAHLPYVRHPENPFHLEEVWLFEAMAECYMPLLGVLERLERDGIQAPITLSLSAPLITMLDDALLRSRFVDHLDRSLELCAAELDRTREMPAFAPLAQMYHERLKEIRNRFVHRYDHDLLAQLAHHDRAGRIELIPAAGTHPLLPFLATDASRRAHIRLAAELFLQRFGRPPRGMWLPECAFTPGLDDLLAEVGIEYSFVESTGLMQASERPLWGPFAPLRAPAGTCFFGRDPESSAKVWSATQGYPGDFVYRDFYRDIGFDLPFDYVKPYIHPDGIRMHTGLKYFRITELGDAKAPYRPDIAAQRALEHATHFVREREAQIASLAEHMPRPPIIVCPYDAELFGHWWFEGPLFLEGVLRAAAASEHLEANTPSRYLDTLPEQQLGVPNTSSWGDKGAFAVWLDASNDWIYRHLRSAERRLVELVEAHPDARRSTLRALDQAARELMLAQASDWAFIMKTGTTVEYAVNRTRTHLERFEALADMLDAGKVDSKTLRKLESADGLFPHMNVAQAWSQSGS